MDLSQNPAPGRQVKRLKRSDDGAAIAGEVVMVLQLLRKHKECKKARFVGDAEAGNFPMWNLEMQKGRKIKERFGFGLPLEVSQCLRV